jgi:hypothetical protein
MQKEVSEYAPPRAASNLAKEHWRPSPKGGEEEKPFPQGLKPQILRVLFGTAKSVPSRVTFSRFR